MVIRNLLVVISNVRFIVWPRLDRLPKVYYQEPLYTHKQKEVIQIVFIRLSWSPASTRTEKGERTHSCGGCCGSSQAHFLVSSNIIDGICVQPGLHFRVVSVLPQHMFLKHNHIFQNYS